MVQARKPVDYRFKFRSCDARGVRSTFARLLESISDRFSFPERKRRFTHKKKEEKNQEFEDFR